MNNKKKIIASEFSTPFHKNDTFKEHWMMERQPHKLPSELDDPLNRTEFQSVIEKCLTHLPEKWRAVFVLKVIEELNSDEVCKELECTASNLWVMLHRARLKLRECIEIKWMK